MSPEWHRTLDELADPYPAKPSQTAVDDRTQLLAPVGKDRFLLPVYEPGRAPVNADGQFLLREYQTAVIPKTAPAQPRADWDRGEDPLPCGKKIQAMGILFGAGLVVGIVLGVVGTVLALVWKVAA